jgi:hypothetical protein
LIDYVKRWQIQLTITINYLAINIVEPHEKSSEEETITKVPEKFSKTPSQEKVYPTKILLENL